MSKKTWITATLGLLFGLISGGTIVYSFSPKQNNKLAQVQNFSSVSSLLISSSSQSVPSSLASSSSIFQSSSSESTNNILPSQNLFGWFENDSISADLIFDKSKVSGQFRNITKGKKYEIEGIYNSIESQLVFQIFDNGLFSGKFEFYNPKLKTIQNQEEYNSTTQFREFESYNPSKNNNIRIIGFTNTSQYHSAEVQLFSKDEYDKFNTKSRILTFRGIDKSYLTNQFVIPTAYFEDLGYYYFTNEVSGPINGLISGDKIKITSKLRLSSQINSYSKSDEKYDEQFPTNTNLFDITSIEKL